MGFFDQLLTLIVKVLCPAQKEQIEQQQQPQEAQQQQQWQQVPQHHQQQQHRPDVVQHHEQPVSYQPAQKPHPNYGKPYHHNDYLAHAQDPHYANLRKEADQVGDEMGRAFRESQEAYERGDGAEAKRLSDKGKALREKRERLHREAANWIYEQNNKGRTDEEVDLHGLRAEEAVERTEAAVGRAREKGMTELRLIVGKGLHSENHKAVLKPKIEELMQKQNLVAEIDPENSGVLVVHIDGQARTGRGIDSDEITRRLEEKDKSCVIM